MLLAVGKVGLFSKRWQKLRGEVGIQGLGRGGVFPRVECDRMASRPFPSARLQAHAAMQHYGVNGYSLHAMNSLSAMYNLHQQAASRPSMPPTTGPQCMRSHWPSAWLVRAVVGTGAAGWRRDLGDKALSGR